MKKKNGAVARAITALLILLVASAVVFAVFGLKSGGKRLSSLNINNAQLTEEKYHLYDKESDIFVVKSGLIELYFDKTAYSVAIRDTAAGRTWYSVPAVRTENEQASVLSVRLSDKNGNIYNLNSQDNSVAFGAASFSSVEGGITVTYNMALDAETAAKPVNELEKGTPAAQVTVEFKLLDGSFYVTVADSDMAVPKGINLESISLLDYFTSTTKVKKDDYIFVPDGCGALIMNSLCEKSGEYSVPVYSSDGEVSAKVPAFGVKQGDAAYMALVESGDEIACINAYTGSDAFHPGRAGASFAVTQMKYVEGKNGKYTVYAGMRSGDDISLTYRFLSGNNASYASFATACREMLIRDSVLSVSSVPQAEYFPILVNIDCAAALNSNGSKTRVLSSFEETEDIVAQLKAKGVNNAFVNLRYALSGANEQSDIKNAKLNYSLGSDEDYEKLYSYTNIQKMKLLVDIGLVTSNAGSSGISASDRLKDITRRSLVIKTDNAFPELSKAKNNAYRVLKSTKIGNRTEALLKNFRNINLSGYCVNDYPAGIVADYSAKKPASSASQAVFEANSSLATERTLAVKGGNFNSIKSASLIVDLPDTTGYEQSAGYKAVPFLQMLLHGTVDYAFEPINSSVDMNKAFLKCVEYGALPSFEWFYRETGSELFDASYKYDNTINSAAEFYERASVLNPLRDCRIIDHTCLQDGVYLVEYSDSSLVYVNYNDTDVEVNDILIGAGDFVVIG